jgi:hypothetical protein
MLAHRGGRFVNLSLAESALAIFVSNQAAMINSLALDVGLGPIAA